MQVDSATIEAFRTDGVAVIRHAFGGWVETLRKGIAANWAEPGPDSHIYTGEKGGGRFLSDYCNWQRIPEYREFIFLSGAARIGAELMDASEVRLFHEHVLVKEAATDVPTPWHQDQPYYCVDGAKTVSLWVPLDDVPRATCPEFIAGSHLWGKFYKPQRFSGAALNEGDALPVLPDINADRGAYDIRGFELEAGDAIAFDYRTVHGAPSNTCATRQRRAFSLRLVGEGATFVRREGLKTSPPFREVTLTHGAKLEGEAFPVIYRRQ